MAELEIDGTFEEQWGIVKSSVKQHHKSLYGNGQPGVVDFVTSTKAQFRLIIVLIAIVGTISGVGTLIVGALEFNRQSQQHMIHPPEIFKSLESSEAFARHETEAQFN